MRLEQLQVQNYRNISQACLVPGRELTVICGNNGQGKTNLLEAVWLLTGGKSFRGAKDSELIQKEQEFAVLEGDILPSGGESRRLRLTVGGRSTPRPGRWLSKSGAEPVRAASLAGTFTAVVFDPNHMSLVKGAPEGRRKFIDGALCQMYPGYLTVYRRYLRAMTQKNALLKQFVKSPRSPALTAQTMDMLEVLNAEFARQGEEIQRRRREYLALLGPMASGNYRDLSHGAEALQVCYAPCFEPGSLADTLRRRSADELRAGFCLVGPHREDLDLLLNGEQARAFASQGQQRSVVLSLKLAEAAAAADITGEHPVLLLDDVLSELDESRKSYLLTRMKEKQTFVTSCDDTDFLKTDGTIYRMEKGCLQYVRGETAR